MGSLPFPAFPTCIFGLHLCGLSHGLFTGDHGNSAGDTAGSHGALGRGYEFLIHLQVSLQLHSSEVHWWPSLRLST
eukprot:symbB.v1.2.007429.t1/scaffold454.1/size202171/3